MDKINEYIYENEIWRDENIICPYCKYNLERDDPEVLYREYDNEEFECPECGRKFFIKGNHDKTTWLNSIKQQGLIEWYKDYAEINDAGRMVILCHYPIHSWNGLYHGSYHLYGHVHAKTVENEDWQKNRFNVCVENINYYPITLDEIVLNSVYTDNHYCIIK